MRFVVYAASVIVCVGAILWVSAFIIRFRQFRRELEAEKFQKEHPEVAAAIDSMFDRMARDIGQWNQMERRRMN